MKAEQAPPAPAAVQGTGQDAKEEMADGTSISEILADFAAGLEYEAIPEAVRERAKHLMLDATGTALASTRWDFAHKTLSAIQGLGGPGECTVIGMPARLPLRDAVLVNGVLVHGLDYDDTHVPGVIHATASAYPCALGAAEQVGASGRELLTAFIVGVEVSARIATAAKGAFHQAGFHPTGLVGAFGCTLAAGRLMGATPAQLAMAQGITLSTAAGSLEFLADGAWTKRLHPGWAGVAAITSAALARQGFTGPREAYEGRYGLFPSHLGALLETCDLGLATEGLRESWEIERVAVKPFPICHLSHGCTDAALALGRAHGVPPEQIERITALVPQQALAIIAEPAGKKLRPKSDYDAKFSVQFCIAAALVREKFGLAELESDAINDAAILALAEKVTCLPDPDTTYPQAFSGQVTLTTSDGRELTHREEVNRGAADRPLSNGEIVEKFMDNAQLAVSRAQAERICDAVLQLDRFADTAELTALLGGQ